MSTDYCMVLCTCPDAIIATQLAQALTEQRLVACTNIVSDLTSIYFWQGKIKQGQEVLMMMKTRQDKLPALEKALLAQHPYEFPEFIAFPILYGNSQYLAWLDEVVGAS